MGPNCNGVINYVDAFAMASTAAIGGPRPPAGDVGVVSHSGGFGQISVMWRAMEIGLGISYEASVGNEADLDSLDFARFMLRSDATRVILMAIEGIKDGRGLIELAREAAEREKPIVVLKLGRTASGSRAAASHTGTIAGEDEIYDAAFRQFGMIRVHEANELYETAVLLRTGRWPQGRRAASAAATGGNIVQLADVGDTLGIEWPEYSAATQAKLAQFMPGYGKVSNPTDMTSLATGRAGKIPCGLERHRGGSRHRRGDADIRFSVPQGDGARRGLSFRECVKPAAMLWIGGCSDDRAFGPKDLIQAGVPVYRNALPCLRRFAPPRTSARSCGNAGPGRRPGPSGRCGRATPRGACSRAPAQADGARGEAGAPELRLPGHAGAPRTSADEALAHARDLGAGSRSRSTRRTYSTRPRRARYGWGFRETKRSGRGTRRGRRGAAPRAEAQRERGSRAGDVRRRPRSDAGRRPRPGLRAVVAAVWAASTSKCSATSPIASHP
jgi:hypothetical protein